MIEGILPPIPTPFSGDDVAYDRLTENVSRWNHTGLSGYVVFGSNGENAYLTTDEKLRLVEVVRESAAPGQSVVAGTGCESTRQTIRLTNEAAARGADAALVLTPSYYKGRMTHEAFVAHFTAVADAADVPILIYDVPKFSGVHIEPKTVIELSQHPNIVGVKCSSGNVAELIEIVDGAAAEFSTLVGTASVIYPGLCVGGRGGILALANVAPDQAVAIYEHARAGRHDAALALQRRFLTVNRAVTAQYGVPGLKAAMDKLGYYGGPVRSPLRPLEQAELDDLDQILRSAGLLKKAQVS